MEGRLPENIYVLSGIVLHVQRGYIRVIAPKTGWVFQRNAVPNLEKELRHGDLLKGNLPGEHPFPQTDAIGRRELAQGRFANA